VDGVIILYRMQKGKEKNEKVEKGKGGPEGKDPAAKLDVSVA
jgi:hypothetical protein